MVRAFAIGLLLAGALCGQRITVSSKNFVESGILAELMAQMIEAHTEIEVERRLDLGGTIVVWQALQSGEIDLYADYTGTGWSIVLKEEGRIRDPLQTFLHVDREYRGRWDVHWLEPFGLNNSYALAMREDQAEAMQIRRISDLALRGQGLRAGLSIEFNEREDGWPGLRETYGLQLDVRALEHGLAYAAIVAGETDVIDAYSTDGKLLRYGLRVLEDDQRFFPPYNAAPLVRGEVLRAHPEIREALARLAFRIPDRSMQELNHRVEVEGASMAEAAREFLVNEGLLDADLEAPGTAARAQGFVGLFVQRAPETLGLLGEHLLLTLIAVLLAACAAIPLGILTAARQRLRAVAIGATGILQTVPSLALLAFMIPVLGLGVQAAVAALFLYALLPILRNTDTGIRGVDPQLIEAARAMGMRPVQMLWSVQLPLALPTIMAGVRTATVISVGVATLAAFIGSGGLGEPIVTGLYLNDTNLILCGAVPAALLAVLADRGLGLLESRLTPKGAAAT